MLSIKSPRLITFTRRRIFADVVKVFAVPSKQHEELSHKDFHDEKFQDYISLCGEPPFWPGARHQ
jgi:hypothetical protein